MSSSVPAAPSPAAVAVSPVAPAAVGRLAVMSSYAIAAHAIPVPFVPDRILERVRGAVVQDVVSRHGLSLTSDAREILASPSGEPGSRALMRKLVEVASRQVLRRFGPIGLASSVVRGVEVYALGHLLERYILKVRATGAVRVHAGEATEIRALVDRAVRLATTAAVQPLSLTSDGGVEDLRDELTRWVDMILLMGASLPAYLQRRLDAAFDDVARSKREGDDG